MSGLRLSLSKNADTVENGKEGCVRGTQEGFPALFKSNGFQNFFEVLKSAPAWRKDFFDKLAQARLCRACASFSAGDFDGSPACCLWRRRQRQTVGGYTRLQAPQTAIRWRTSLVTASRPGPLNFLGSYSAASAARTSRTAAV